MVCAKPILLESMTSNVIRILTEICQLHTGVQLMGIEIRSRKQHILWFYIHMNDTIPSTLVTRGLVCPIAAIAEGICH